MTTSTRVGSGRSGWTVFAGSMLLVAGILNAINGIQAIHDSSFYVHDIVYHNLTVWGWIFLIWGALQVVAGLAALAQRSLGSYLGVFLAAVSACLWFFFVFAAPFGALLGVTINIMVIYGLTVGAVEEGTLS